jgi:hypothetical protein
LHRYSVYGFVIDSALPLPELTASAEAMADVGIRFGSIDWSPPADDLEDRFLKICENEIYLSWDSVGKFLVRAGREVVVHPSPGAEESLIRLPLLGIVLALLLHQRGYLVLHGSAVAVNGRAIAFLGNKGWGKSTVAASLYRRGHRLLADDVVALRIDGNEPPILWPGFPQFKLYPESAAASLGIDPGGLPPLASFYDKRACPAGNQFSHRALPLDGVYLLAIGDALSIDLIHPNQAFTHMVEHSYAARFGDLLLNGATASAHLHQCTSLLNRVPVYRLTRPSSLDLLHDVAQFIERQELPRRPFDSRHVVSDCSENTA